MLPTIRKVSWGILSKRISFPGSRWLQTTPNTIGVESRLRGRWEPEVDVFENMRRNIDGSILSLNQLIVEDVNEARDLFTKVLSRKYPNDAGMWNRWAVMEWKAGDIEKARKIFRRGSKIQVEPELWQSWAMMEMAEKNYSDAEKLFKVVLASSPDDAHALLGLIQLDKERGNFQKARDQFEQLHEKFPENTDILQKWAVFEGEMQNARKARELFERRMSLPDMKSRDWQVWADMERKHGDLALAREVLDEGLSRHPRSGLLLHSKASFEFDVGNLAEARHVLERIQFLGIMSPHVYNTWAKMEEKQGNVDRARSLYDRALAISPEHVPCIISLALFEERHGDAKAARRVFEIGLEKTNRDIELLKSYAVFEENERNYAKAREIYENLRLLRPSWLDPLFALARIESKLRNINRARELMKEASKKFESNPEVLSTILLRWGLLEQHSKNPANARRLFSQAAKTDMTNARAWNYRALLELTHDPERARNTIETAFRHVGHNEGKSWSVLTTTYGRAMAALGNFEEAAESFNKSLQLEPNNWRTREYFADNVLRPTNKLDEARQQYELALLDAPLWKHKSLTSKLNNL